MTVAGPDTRSARRGLSARPFGFVLVALVCTAVCGAIALPGAVAQDDPGEPVNVYGSAVDEAGNPIPTGTTIHAVVDGEIEDSLTVDDAGSFGGPDAFDEQLAVNTGAGETVVFTVEGVDGPVASETVDLDEADGVVEVNLTFPGETFADSVGLAGVSLSLGASSLDVGATTEATVTATFENDSQRAVTDAATVESLAPAVATADGGTITGESAGTATIQVSYTVNGTTATDTAEVTVEEEPVTLTGVALALARPTVEAGETTALTVTATFDNGSEADVTDSAAVESLDTGVATVSGSTVFGESAGTATVTADYQGLSDSAELTVEAAGESLFEVTGVDAPGSVAPDEAFDVTATVTNAGDAPGSVTVSHEFGGVESQTSLDLAPGDTETLTLSTVAPDEPGVFEHTVSTPGDSNTATTTVESENGGDDDGPDDGTDDGGSDDGGSDDGGDDGGQDDGTGDNGTSDDGTGDNGTSDDGTGDNGTSDDGTGDDGTSDDGTGDDAADDPGTGDSADDPGAGDGTSDPGSDGGNDGLGPGFGIVVVLCGLLGLIGARLERT